jgi:hypothetical protein
VRYDLVCGSLKASFISYGATLLSLLAPGRDGQAAADEMTLQHNHLQDLLASPAYYGENDTRIHNSLL